MGMDRNLKLSIVITNNKEDGMTGRIFLTTLRESYAQASLRDALLPKLMRGEVRVKDVIN